MKVFIADDSKEVCDSLSAILSDIFKIEVVGTAHDAQKSIESIQRLKPDVVILDIAMPGGDGKSVLKIIKKDKHPSTVIMFTNYPQYEKICLEAGADFFIDKSNGINKILQVLNQLSHNLK